MMGSINDPEDGQSVASTLMASVFVYAVRLIFRPVPSAVVVYLFFRLVSCHLRRFLPADASDGGGIVET